MTGISAGAINSGGASQFVVGDEVAMADYLVDEWGKITEESLFATWNWPLGVLQGLFLKHGMVDTHPLRKTFESIAFTHQKRDVILGGTDMDTGLNVPLTNFSTTEDLINGMMKDSLHFLS